MTITYHKDIPVDNHLTRVPHIMLDKKIRKFIKDKNVKQDTYPVKANPYWFFIYLDNGDRIDIQVKEN